MITLFLPNWLYPDNIGDSLVSTFVPGLLKKLNPKEDLQVISYGRLLEVLQKDPSIDICRLPSQEETTMDFGTYAFSSEKQDPSVKVVVAGWHPRLFSFWREHHEHLTNHPTANILTVNFLLQLQLEDLLFDNTQDFSSYCNLEPLPRDKHTFNIGIVISTKLAGKNNPHPGCDGIGYRYKLESWKSFVDELKTQMPDVKIYEFSQNFLEIGDYHVPYVNSFLDLFHQIDSMDLGVLSDGGIHHAFNLRNKPLVLFQPNILSKVEFLKLSNSYFPDHLHLECRKSCRSYFTEVFGGIDKSKSCNMECESLDPIKLAEYTIQIIKQIKNNKNN